MGVIFVTVLFLFVSIILLHFFDNVFGLDIFCIGILVVSSIALIIEFLGAFSANIGVDGFVYRNQKKYESLVYQLENNLYDNDNDIGKKELYDEICDWNTDLAQGKALQNDFWCGIFYPDVYDQFDFIELK